MIQKHTLVVQKVNYSSSKILLTSSKYRLVQFRNAFMVVQIIFWVVQKKSSLVQTIHFSSSNIYVGQFKKILWQFKKPFCVVQKWYYGSSNFFYSSSNESSAVRVARCGSYRVSAVHNYDYELHQNTFEPRNFV